MYGNLWDNYKGDLTMTDLAKILRVDVSLLFYVLKKGKENNN